MIFSVVFFFVCSFYFFFGVYILYINPKENINRMFFAICLSLFIWSFGFTIAISAPNMDTCLFWRRICSIGWGTFFCEVLYYVMILTGKRNLLKKWWNYFLALPAIIIILLVAFTNGRNTLIEYKLVYTTFGWTNIASNHFWNFFFYIYYIGYMIIGLIMIWHWRRTAVDSKIKNQANIILCSCILSLMIALVTDIIGNSILTLYIPPIVLIVMLIPTIAIYYSITKSQFMKQQPNVDETLNLTEANRIKIYKHLSSVFIAGSFLFFISQYLFSKNADLTDVLVSSIILIFLGLAIKVIQHLKVNENYKSNIIIAAVVFTIPMITFKFIDIGSMTIWAFPFLFIITSLLLNKPNGLIFISISIMGTQILVWIMAPQVQVTVDSSDHMARIGLFAIGIWLAYFVNKIYIIRLKENIYQVKFQTLLSDISTSFVTINTLNFDIKINEALKKCREFFKVDITNMALFDMQQKKIISNHKWNDMDNSNKIPVFREMGMNQDLWWIRQLLANKVVQMPEHDKQIEIIGKDSYLMTRSICNTLFFVPILGKNTVLGFLEFSLIQSPKQWRSDHINLFTIISKVFSDALLKVKAEKEINYMAYYDQLTNLPNRILFKDRVNQAIYLASRTEKLLGIVFLNLNAFSTINDTIGHEGGDKLLKKVAMQLLQCLRKSDTVCRFGGDEFLIMINNISDRNDIAKIADKIMGLFNQDFILKGQDFFVSASAGISIYPEDGQNTESLIKNASIAMYKAKDMGKNHYMLCSSEMKEELYTKIKLTNSLYHAKERNELYLNYQPQVCLKTMQIKGLEALIRWKHPKRGIIPPSIFIPLAEQSGVINYIGEWVLETACHQNKIWQDLGLPPMRIAVNLSVNQFRNPNLVEQVSEILRKTGLHPKYLELEITESITIKEENYIVSVLNSLKELGVSISIDDFGTEYSSLSRLKILPIDRIKIDMQFISGIEKNEKDRVITDSIINLAKNLGLSVIAEGVETEKQLEFLNQKICDEVQGYYLYKPMPAEEIEGIIMKKH